MLPTLFGGEHKTIFTPQGDGVKYTDYKPDEGQAPSIRDWLEESRKMYKHNASAASFRVN